MFSRRTMAARSEELAKEIHALAGKVSTSFLPKQLSVVLFEKLSLPPRKKTKTGYSTDSEVLEGLKTCILSWARCLSTDS